MKNYDLNYYYEGEGTPALFAYELYRDPQGYLSADTSDEADTYRFTEADCEWLLANVTDTDGKTYNELSDFWVDEWYGVTDMHLYDMYLPPMAKAWIASLPEYEVK
jgi:hypothetical protein